jgi:hypothetical protein
VSPENAMNAEGTEIADKKEGSELAAGKRADSKQNTQINRHTRMVRLNSVKQNIL